MDPQTSTATFLEARCGGGNLWERLGLTRPFLVPTHPTLSQIALNFVAGLPPSWSNSIKLTIVDHFTKSVHSISLSKLPISTETANLMVTHVFHLDGIPLDIVLDQGLQFISLVWKPFYNALGATISLFTGFHLWMNRQAPIRSSRQFWGSWGLRVLCCGGIACPGPNLHTSSSPLMPQVWLLLNVLWDICHTWRSSVISPCI